MGERDITEIPLQQTTVVLARSDGHVNRLVEGVEVGREVARLFIFLFMAHLMILSVGCLVTNEFA